MARARWSISLAVCCLFLACSDADGVWTADRSAGDTDGRGFRLLPGERAGFSLALAGPGLAARFDEFGARLGPIGERAGLVFHTTRWRRGGAWTVAQQVAATLHTCEPADRRDAVGDCRERLEYRRPGVVEWWQRAGLGLEFGFTVNEAPIGDGALELEVAVDGATRLDPRGGGASIAGDGRVWTVSGVAAWDSRGVPLASTLAVVDHALLLRVDLDGAVLPVTVDPIVTTPSTILTCGETACKANRYVSGAGDVNGDGFADVMSGGFLLSDPARIYLGSATGTSSVPAVTITASKNAWIVADAGDVDGDGFDDILVATSDTVEIFHGSLDGVAPVSTTTLNGPVANINSNFVDGAGDVNSDGFDDVIYGNFVHHGSASGVSVKASAVLTTPDADPSLGNSVAGAGDVNGDGHDDVVVATNSAVYVFSGAPGSVQPVASAHLTWPATPDIVPWVAAAGDVNHDCHDDVVVGMGRQGSGTAWVFHGSPAGIATATADAADRILTTSPDYPDFGQFVAGAGDVDGDGYDDVLVAAAATVGAPTVFLYRGSATGIPATADTIIGAPGGIDGYNLSSRIDGAGDVNGDGFDDVVVGFNAKTDHIYQGYAGQGAKVGMSCDEDTGSTGATNESDSGSAASADTMDPPPTSSAGDTAGGTSNEEGTSSAGDGDGGDCSCRAPGQRDNATAMVLLVGLLVRRRIRAQA